MRSRAVRTTQDHVCRKKGRIGLVGEKSSPVGLCTQDTGKRPGARWPKVQGLSPYILSAAFWEVNPLSLSWHPQPATGVSATL